MEKSEIYDRTRQVFVEREDQIQPEIEPIGASMQYRGRSDRRRIQLNLRAPAFVKFVNDIERDRRDLVEELPSKATSLQDMTTLLGIIFAAKVDPLFVIRRVTLMESFRKKNILILIWSICSRRLETVQSTARICNAHALV